MLQAASRDQVSQVWILQLISKKTEAWCENRQSGVENCFDMFWDLAKRLQLGLNQWRPQVKAYAYTSRARICTLTPIEADLETLSGPRVLGLAQWRKDRAKVSKSSRRIVEPGVPPSETWSTQLVIRWARPLNLAAMFFCASAQKHKIGNTSSQKWVLRSNELTQQKETFYIYELITINVTSAWTWMNFNQVMRTENVMKITFIRFFLNVCKFMLCIASWKLERLLAQ